MGDHDNEGFPARGAFIAELKASGSVAAAARAAGMSRQAAYNLRNRDTRFAAAWLAATGDGRLTALEAALIERATNGTERYRFTATGTEIWREYDNKLALDLLTRLWPERYGPVVAAAVPEKPAPEMTREQFMALLANRRSRLLAVHDET